jgi:hypothetical protein
MYLYEHMPLHVLVNNNHHQKAKQHLKETTIQPSLLGNGSVNDRCYIMASTDMPTTTEELMEAVFSVWSVPRLHNEEQLQL